MTEHDEQSAMTAYVLLARDYGDFLDYIKDMSGSAKYLLWKMLTTPNPNMSEDNLELNRAGAALLQPFLKVMPVP